MAERETRYFHTVRNYVGHYHFFLSRPESRVFFAPGRGCRVLVVGVDNVRQFTIENS